jgi:hypothetical protein
MMLRYLGWTEAADLVGRGGGLDFGEARVHLAT